MSKISFLHKLGNHGVFIATSASIVLLITAAFIGSFSLWVILPAWIILGFCFALRFSSVSNESPYKKAFFLLGIPLLFYFGFWESAFRNLLKLIFEPSFQNLVNCLTNRPFLVLIILYLASACIFYSIKLQEQKDSFESTKKQLMDTIELMKKKQQYSADESIKEKI